jgi:hypothetical protein
VSSVCRLEESVGEKMRVWRRIAGDEYKLYALAQGRRYSSSNIQVVRFGCEIVGSYLGRAGGDLGGAAEVIIKSLSLSA